MRITFFYAKISMVLLIAGSYRTILQGKDDSQKWKEYLRGNSVYKLSISSRMPLLTAAQASLSSGNPILFLM